jgi:hypothetical protein
MSLCGKSVLNIDCQSLSALTLTNGVSFVTITAPATGIYIISLPPNIGAPGQVLTTNGAGQTSWTTSTVGTVVSVSATVPSFLAASVSNPTTIPNINIMYSGTALPVANGGTGKTAGGLPTQVLTTGLLGDVDWDFPFIIAANPTYFSTFALTLDFSAAFIAKIATIESNISSLQSTVNILVGDVNGLLADVITLNGTVAANTSAITTQ